MDLLKNAYLERTTGSVSGLSKTQRQERHFVMDNTQRGKLILKAVPAGKSEKKVVMLLAKFARSASMDALTAKVRNTPYTISNDIEAQKAVLIIEAFQKCGATAAFFPHATIKPATEEPAPVQRPSAEPDAEALSPVQKPPVFSFESDSASSVQATPPPSHVRSPKNRARRLTQILVIILLLLSLGYLSWQLWPVIGAKLQELINFLKHNI
jgi:hypothetical protein